MLNLVAQGPKMAVAKTTQPQELKQYFIDHFQAVQMAQLGLGKHDQNIASIVCVVDTAQNEADGTMYFGMEQNMEYILCHMMDAEVKPLIASMRALPQVVVFNSLGEHAPVVDKIQAEFQCERTSTRDLLLRENNEGVIVAFLMNETEAGREFCKDTLFINQPYADLMSYLRIHAPRYLAKAFEPNAWHMVDLRIYDRYEVYDLQYKRLVKAIQALNLGYIVTETWNREVSTFTEPVGTYHIRLLTFLEPLELKKMLMGLEYSASNRRIVDLNVIWHNKKISWRNLLDNKEIRKQLKDTTAPFFPKSNFFAVQNDKALLIKHCVETVNAKLTAEDKEALRELERSIIALGKDDEE